MGRSPSGWWGPSALQGTADPTLCTQFGGSRGKRAEVDLSHLDPGSEEGVGHWGLARRNHGFPWSE